jgi:hypothetical protein
MIAIIDPPEKCPFCSQERAGIQEGLVIFKCQTYMRYSETDLISTIQSLECQKKVNLIG